MFVDIHKITSWCSSVYIGIVVHITRLFLELVPPLLVIINSDIELQTEVYYNAMLQVDEFQSMESSGILSSNFCGAEDTILHESIRFSHDCSSRESSPLQLYDLSLYENEQLSSTPLYDGAKMSDMDALVKYLHWFSEHSGISKEVLSDILKLEHA